MKYSRAGEVDYRIVYSNMSVDGEQIFSINCSDDKKKFLYSLFVALPEKAPKGEIYTLINHWNRLNAPWIYWLAD